MVEIDLRQSYVDSRKRGGKLFNKPSKKSGHLTKNGQIYRNTLLDADWTSQTGVIRKIK
jgi:hypothetical protein